MENFTQESLPAGTLRQRGLNLGVGFDDAVYDQIQITLDAQSQSDVVPGSRNYLLDLPLDGSRIKRFYEQIYTYMAGVDQATENNVLDAAKDVGFRLDPNAARKIAAEMNQFSCFYDYAVTNLYSYVSNRGFKPDYEYLIAIRTTLLNPTCLEITNPDAWEIEKLGLKVVNERRKKLKLDKIPKSDAKYYQRKTRLTPEERIVLLFSITDILLRAGKI